MANPISFNTRSDRWYAADHRFVYGGDPGLWHPHQLANYFVGDIKRFVFCKCDK